MLLRRQEENGVVEALFNSSNLFKALYLKGNKIMYVFFKKGGVYSYFNMDNEMYEQFELAESQGEFFAQNIKNNARYPHSKEFKMKDFEINDLTNRINEAIKDLESPKI
jgi:translation elongation factor P/translation initiation factor 5A